VPIRAGAALITRAAARHPWMKRVRRAVLGLRSAGLVVLAVVAEAPVAAPARAGDEAVKAASPVAPIAVEGTVLKITLTDGRVLSSRDLIGASLLIDQGDRLRPLRLDSIERDPDDKRRDIASADVIWLHSFAIEGPTARGDRYARAARRQPGITTLLDLSKKDADGRDEGPAMTKSE
jgi:hypothetical protein